MTFDPVLVAAPAETPAFSDLLRESTKTVHREAERAGFIADLIRARATREGYALFLRNLHPAYAAMEPALAHYPSPPPVLSAFADPKLSRLAALESDLVALAGPGWAEALPKLPAAGAYAAAIEAVAADAPRLAAHAYARYLGDLSGGQILTPLLGRTLGLGPESVAFYDFPRIEQTAEPKAAMRAALDHVAPGGPDAAALIEEAIAAFRHNIAVSEAVQAALAAP